MGEREEKAVCSHRQTMWMSSVALQQHLYHFIPFSRTHFFPLSPCSFLRFTVCRLSNFIENWQVDLLQSNCCTVNIMSNVKVLYSVHNNADGSCFDGLNEHFEWNENDWKCSTTQFYVSPKAKRQHQCCKNHTFAKRFRKNMENSGKQQIRLIWCELIYFYVYPTAPLTFYNFDASELLCVGIGAVEKHNLCENSQMIQQKSFDLPNKKTDQIYRCCYFNNFRCSCVCRLFPQYLQNAGFCECWISSYLWYWFGVWILTSNVFVNM